MFVVILFNNILDESDTVMVHRREFITKLGMKYPL